MRRAALAILLAGCGHAAPAPTASPGDGHATPPTCDAIVAHLAIVFDQHDLAAADRADLIASCNKSNPSAAERTCVMKAQAPADVDACGRALHDAAQAAPAPDDPRADLLELGGRVHAYLAAMGEPPPPAAATPPAGTCCAQACATDASLWTGPWQLIRFGLEHATRWSFAIERDDTGVTVRAIGCAAPTTSASYALRVSAAAAPSAADVTSSEAP